MREAVFDTAYGAKLIHSNQLTDTAAIASKEAAGQYGLKILEKDIHDKERGDNIQRYLILARYVTELSEQSRQDRRPFHMSTNNTLNSGAFVFAY